MYFAGTVAGSAVAVFLISIFISWILRAMMTGQSQWKRMRVGVPLGVLASVVISYFGTSGPYQAEEWPPMVLAYILAGFFWFVVALIVSSNEKTDTQMAATKSTSSAVGSLTELEQEMTSEVPEFSGNSSAEKVLEHETQLGKKKPIDLDDEQARTAQPPPLPQTLKQPENVTEQNDSTENRLRRLRELVEMGLVTEEEAAQKRKEILSDF